MEKNYVTSIREDNLYRIKLSGEADIDFVNAFSSIAQKISTEPKKIALVVDVEKVSYIDSMAITVFIKLIRIYKALNRSIIIYKPQTEVMNIFEISCLDKLVIICKDKRELNKAVKEINTQ